MGINVLKAKILIHFTRMSGIDGGKGVLDYILLRIKVIVCKCVENGKPKTIEWFYAEVKI